MKNKKIYMSDLLWLDKNYTQWKPTNYLFTYTLKLLNQCIKVVALQYHDSSKCKKIIQFYKKHISLSILNY